MKKFLLAILAVSVAAIAADTTKVEAKKDTAKKVLIKKAEAKKDTAKKELIKKVEAKKDTAKKVEAKVDSTKK
jgi:Ni/Co efflux regulator RcnB